MPSIRPVGVSTRPNIGGHGGSSAPSGGSSGVGVGIRLPFAKGGKVKKMASGGSASKRADGCAVKGKTKGKMV